jgi:hypothetical protein
MKTAKGKVLKFRPRSKRKPKPLRPLPPLPPANVNALKAA